VSIADNLKKIEDEINETCVRSGRARSSVRLMGVSKFHPSSSVEAAINAGLTLFGESRVQEALPKFENYKSRCCTDGGATAKIEVHLIGTLQRNKAKHARFFDCVQSCDRMELIDALDGGAVDAAPLPIMLEVNSGEEQKGGFRGIDSLFCAVEEVLSRKNLLLCGLMTMAPLAENESGSKARNAFANLRDLRQKLEEKFACKIPELSMGMSGDYKIAIEEGSTLVRIGQAIFGERV
jgi:pyridoxal phosphate enzyme (YggS family)